MSDLAGWARGSHTARGETHDTYRKGSGPGVVLVHEIPGITPEVIRFADDVVARGYTVVMPSLFGRPGASATPGEIVRSIGQVCINREFVKLRAGVTSPVTHWLRSLARSLHAELGGPGVGALGMCLTGGFALAMMVDESVAAPVVAQPSLPAALGAVGKADLGLSPADLAAVRRRVAEGCPVLGVRYRDDPATGTRFETLATEFGGDFIRVELEGKGHATLTAHRQQVAVDRVLAFFDERLRPGGPSA
ncbi:dienelactone hydrolase family protein [Intrasporangium sp.]|uniref:dienelactone hydrolase family protein n=1 Tax=Intrasporangium sp. TaxID=1925024 RepID=UPI0033657D24